MAGNTSVVLGRRLPPWAADYAELLAGRRKRVFSMAITMTGATSGTFWLLGGAKAGRGRAPKFTLTIRGVIDRNTLLMFLRYLEHVTRHADRTKRCAGCGAWFLARAKKDRYCRAACRPDWRKTPKGREDLAWYHRWYMSRSRLSLQPFIERCKREGKAYRPRKKLRRKPS